MKASEMIAMLEANPKLKFDNNRGQVWGMRKDGTYAGIVDRISFTPKISLDDNYELIQEPVAWQEAMQAWAEGKKVRCVFENQQGAIYVFKSFHAKAETSTNLSRDMITKGTWYIDE